MSNCMMINHITHFVDFYNVDIYKILEIIWWKYKNLPDNAHPYSQCEVLLQWSTSCPAVGKHMEYPLSPVCTIYYHESWFYFNK
jgi:uncharacterized membrane protein